MSKSFKTEEFPMSENLKVTALSKNNNKKKACQNTENFTISTIKHTF